ncbi:hypothetical protein DH2020_019040 [Rehmannia glutinosa]|uniref:Glycosyltransferase 61 catalytic domain-containing protein n=1 Tax=Rehmannia glutinosa TaxID=99300 RepID=A0ABR0WMN2_REHGL
MRVASKTDAYYRLQPTRMANSVLVVFGDAVNLKLSIHAVEDMLLMDDTSHNSMPTVGSAANLQMSINAAQNTLKLNDANATSQPIAIKTQKTEPLCRILEAGADYCEIEGDIRVDANTSTVFVLRRRPTISEPMNSWTIQPYPRKGISHVKNWTVTLSKHKLVDIDREKQVHCYDKLIAGLQFYKELIINPSSEISMYKFRQFLRQAYSLERTKAIKWTKGHGTKPRLMIVSRKRTRILLNDVEVSRVARKLGYEVVLAEAEMSTNLTRFAQIVNSCDVLMGIHGAGLTNMVFLPDNAVLIQVVPLGGIDGFARLDFENPAAGMNIRYLEYKIKTKESSLGTEYPIDHPVLKDPLYFHRKGWGEVRSIYLDNQNVTIDVHRFKGTLAKALKLLRH